MPIITTGSNSINISAIVGVVVKEGMRSRSSASDVLPLQFTTQPQSKTVDEYSLATFSTSVTGGTAPYTYQWKKNGTNVGANSANLSFTAAAADKNASITVVVTDSAGSVITSSPAVLGVTSYAFKLDGVTQYWKLSSNIPLLVGDVIKVGFVGATTVGVYKRFFGEGFGLSLDTGASGTKFRQRSGNGYLNGVSLGGSEVVSVPTSGIHTCSIIPTNNANIIAVGAREDGSDMLNFQLYNFEIIRGGVTIHKIALNNKSTGATQAASVGSVTATLLNYNASGWLTI